MKRFGGSAYSVRVLTALPRGLVALVQQVINERGARCPVSQFAGCATHSGQHSQVGVDNLDVRAMKE